MGAPQQNEPKWLEYKSLLSTKTGGRPHKSIDKLIERINKENRINIEMLNDYLYKIDGKYFMLNLSISFALRHSRIELVECTNYPQAIIGHIVYSPYKLIERPVEPDDYKISFVFDRDGALAENKVMVKLAAMGLISRYNCFRHDINVDKMIGTR